jgi:amidohydrolase
VNSELRQSILNLAREIAPGVLRIRRELHQHPELSTREFRTAALIERELTSIGIGFQAGFGGTTGVRAILRGEAPAGNSPGRVVALRADMDALPIQEDSGLDYASSQPGVMHACGHDAHVAMLLGAARLLHGLRHAFSSTVVFIFQPAEERAPGGAQALIKAGVLEDPRPDLIIGQHVNPQLAAGSFGFRPGIAMASVDDLLVTISGSGGHGAMPQLCVDPVAVSAQVINALQLLVSRQADPRIPTVLTFGRISGEGASNIIPGKVQLEGTFRTVDEAWRREALAGIQKIIRLTAEAHRAIPAVTVINGYPALVNDPALTGELQRRSRLLFGPDRVCDLELFMGAEDFAYYAQAVPACFYNLGVGDPRADWNPPLHHPGFRIEESALESGFAMLAWLAMGHCTAD